jgi:hypothetical protein
VGEFPELDGLEPAEVELWPWLDPLSLGNEPSRDEGLLLWLPAEELLLILGWGEPAELLELAEGRLEEELEELELGDGMLLELLLDEELEDGMAGELLALLDEELAEGMDGILLLEELWLVDSQAQSTVLRALSISRRPAFLPRPVWTAYWILSEAVFIKASPETV